LGVIAPGLPFQIAHLIDAAGGVDETVERTSDQSEEPESGPRVARTLDVVA
jgi:hypothetical protein